MTQKLSLRLTQHIRYGLTPLPFGTLRSAMSYMLGTLCEIPNPAFKRGKFIKIWLMV